MSGVGITYLWASKEFPPFVRLEGRRGDYEVYTPERTCKVESCCAYTYDFSPEIYYEFEMQCGGSFDWNDEEPPNYCPNCGAKVVNDGQQLDEEDEG